MLRATMLMILFFPLILSAFEPKLVTSYPVVGLKQISFFDDFQKMNREILVWYPVEPQAKGVLSHPWDVFHVAMNAPPSKSPAKKPLIVLSHGYLGNPHHFSWLIRSLVYHGFIVAGIQHIDLMEERLKLNQWQRARDIKIMLDQILSDSIVSMINQDQIGMAGYSLGGIIAIWVAGGLIRKLPKLNGALPFINEEMISKDWRDLRIKAAFVMAPAFAWLFDEESLAQIAIPTYLIAAEEDRIATPKDNADFLALHIPHAIYQTLSGKAGHYIFISALSESQRKLASPGGQFDFLLQDDVSVDRSWIQFQVAEQAAAFFYSLFQK